MPKTNEVNIELFKVAYNRLNFQDEYLFKFSALFMTINGALGLSMSKLEGFPPVTAFLLSGLGFVICLVWALWIRQNDYWHSVWVGILRKLEADIPGNVKLFSIDAKSLADSGNRSSRLVFRGANIAICIPASFMFAWVIVFAYLACK